MIYNEIELENDEICVIKLLKMIEISGVEEIKRALKSKSSSLMIDFDNDSRINYFEIKIKSTQKFNIKSLSLSLSLSLFKKCSRIYKILRI